MTMQLASFVLISCLAYHVANAEVCADIDSNACVLLERSRPDLCSDPNLSVNVCKRYCGKCPIQCYDCPDPTQDPTTCSTKITCEEGQMCSTRELKALDGRHWFAFGCIDRAVCEGSGLGISFGRRDVDKRDISIHCCNKDFCNTEAMTIVPMTTVLITNTTTAPTTTTTTAPTTTTTTTPTPTQKPACDKNILFAIDENNGADSVLFKRFIKDTVTALGIDNTTTQVGIVVGSKTTIP